MSKAHYNEETGLFHEEHFRNELAKVSFTQSVMEKYLTYEERDKLVNALRDEIKDIPTIWIPYGTFFHDGRMFVYSSGWDEEEEFYEQWNYEPDEQTKEIQNTLNKRIG